MISFGSEDCTVLSSGDSLCNPCDKCRTCANASYYVYDSSGPSTSSPSSSKKNKENDWYKRGKKMFFEK